MKHLNLFTETNRKKWVNKRSKESKFGEHVQLITKTENIYEQLQNLDVSYVLLGIPEDIGVFANGGETGTSNAWISTLKTLLNLQSNTFTNPNKLVVLGTLDFSEYANKIAFLNPKKRTDQKKARKLVCEIDKVVSQLVHDIVRAGKKPIIIGGGHNNAYGILKGTALALNSPINCINFDTHSNFRTEEGRHNGNAFSYAFSEGFLKKYFVFGLHEKTTSQDILNTLKGLKKFVQFNTYEALEIRKELKFKKECKHAFTHIGNSNFGIEIDCNAIAGIPTSAMIPCGFTPSKAREFISFFGAKENASYLHICEAAPNLGSKKTASLTAKLISYLVTDFMR
ncbi:MAG: formimidoylglutamase [Flavobacteriaceae bacterium]|nr:formimidoylglutamase [Flavobacteriaceae bacterium]